MSDSLPSFQENERANPKSTTEPKLSKKHREMKAEQMVPVAALGSMAVARSSSSLRNTLVIVGVIMILTGYGFAGYLLYKRLSLIEKEIQKLALLEKEEEKKESEEQEQSTLPETTSVTTKQVSFAPPSNGYDADEDAIVIETDNFTTTPSSENLFSAALSQNEIPPEETIEPEPQEIINTTVATATKRRVGRPRTKNKDIVDNFDFSGHVSTSETLPPSGDL